MAIHCIIYFTLYIHGTYYCTQYCRTGEVHRPSVRDLPSTDRASSCNIYIKEEDKEPQPPTTVSKKFWTTRVQDSVLKSLPSFFFRSQSLTALFLLTGKLKCSVSRKQTETRSAIHLTTKRCEQSLEYFATQRVQFLRKRCAELHVPLQQDRCTTVLHNLLRRNEVSVS